MYYLKEHVVVAPLFKTECVWSTDYPGNHLQAGPESVLVFVANRIDTTEMMVIK
jgi:hypothetical protein